MTRFKTIAAAAAASALLVSSVAADARPRWRHHRGHDVDTGDVLLGAAILGGVILGADALAKKNNRELDGGSGRPVSRKDDTAEDVAVEACADAAERQLAASDAEARVDSIGLVRRDGAGWRVEGRLATRNGHAGFVCGARGGRADFVQIGREGPRFEGAAPAETVAYRR